MSNFSFVNFNSFGKLRGFSGCFGSWEGKNREKNRKGKCFFLNFIYVY